MTNPPLGDIQTFVYAAEAGNFTRAAKVLKLTPSAVSKSVARLEAELGVRLFHRSPRQITLTADGETFFGACRAGLATIEDAHHALRGQQVPWQGRLRVSVPVSFGQFVVAPALGSWLARRPGLEVELILTDRRVDMTAERFDLTVVLGEVPDSRLIARALPPHRFLTVASPGYLQRQGMPQSPSELSNHTCLRYIMANTGQVRTWMFERNGQSFRHFPIGPLATDHAAVLLSLAQDGQGIIQAPAYVVAAALAAKRLTRVLADFDSLGAPLHVVYEPSRQPSQRTRDAVDFLLGLG